MRVVYRMIPERYSLLKIDAAAAGLCTVASLLFYWLTVQPCLQRQAIAAEQRRELLEIGRRAIRQLLDVQRSLLPLP